MQTTLLYAEYSINFPTQLLKQNSLSYSPVLQLRNQNTQWEKRKRTVKHLLWNRKWCIRCLCFLLVLLYLCLTRAGNWTNSWSVSEELGSIGCAPPLWLIGIIRGGRTVAALGLICGFIWKIGEDSRGCICGRNQLWCGTAKSFLSICDELLCHKFRD